MAVLRWMQDRITRRDVDAIIDTLRQAERAGLVREDWQIYAPDGARRFLITITGGQGPSSERAYSSREALALAIGLSAGIEQIEILRREIRKAQEIHAPDLAPKLPVCEGGCERELIPHKGWWQCDTRGCSRYGTALYSLDGWIRPSDPDGEIAAGWREAENEQQ
jgi:hypothetical protein